MAAMRRQILDAARIVFERQGVADSSINDISAQAGLSVGSIYVHFRSKEDVLLRIIETVDDGAAPFDSCTSAGELLGLIESILRLQDLPGEDGQSARTALEVATITRRNAQVQAVVARNYARLRGSVIDAVVRVGKAAGRSDRAQMQSIAEALLALLVAAQIQMLLGLSPDTEPKIKSARMLLEMLHGGPVRMKR
jgi:AcrR family transcriptional regulator